MDLSLDDRLTGSLGGMLGIKGAADALTLARSDRQRLGTHLLRALTADAPSAKPLLAPADVYRVVPRRTWIRRKSEGKLTGVEFDGLYRLVRLQMLAELVFHDPQRAQGWLHSPKSRLVGATPIDSGADTLGFDAVQAWLHEIDQSYFA